MPPVNQPKMDRDVRARTRSTTPRAVRAAENDVKCRPSVASGIFAKSHHAAVELDRSRFHYAIESVLLIMAALWNRAGHYIFALWFLLLLSSSRFFPRLI